MLRSNGHPARSHWSSSPFARLVGERRERLRCRECESRHQADQHRERLARIDGLQVTTGDTPLEKEGVPLPILIQQADRPVAVPPPKRLGLVIALGVGELDLEDRQFAAGASHRHHQRHGRIGVGIADGQ